MSELVSTKNIHAPISGWSLRVNIDDAYVLASPCLVTQLSSGPSLYGEMVLLVARTGTDRFRIYFSGMDEWAEWLDRTKAVLSTPIDDLADKGMLA